MNIFENWKWRSLWLKGKSKVWCCSNVFKWEWKWKCDIKTGGWSNVPSESESESVISKQEVVPRCSKVIQGSQVEGNHWTEGGVHPLIIRAPATQSLHRCTPNNIYTNYEVFSDFGCCWKKTLQIYVIAQCPCRRPQFYSSASRQCPPKLGNFPFEIVTSLFPLSFTQLEIALNHYSSPFEDFEVSVITFYQKNRNFLRKWVVSSKYYSMPLSQER